jgi:hypothetical protein
VRGCCGEGPEGALLALQQQADFEVAQLDARSVDFSVYAHHPNPYVRALALNRLKAQVQAASDAQLGRVAQLLGDGSAIHSAHCASLLTSCEQGQGVDMHRGICQQQAKTVGALADELLALAPPERVVRAIVTFLAEPGLSELTERLLLVESQPPLTRLREAASSAPTALTASIAERLPAAASEVRKRLIVALSVAPLGSAEPRVVSLVAASLGSKDVVESTRAAVAIVRLTDRPGPVATPVADEPRKSAVRLLEAQLRTGNGGSTLASLGPSASVLLDALIARVERERADPQLLSYAVRDAALVASIGPRAGRVAPLLLALGKQISGQAGTDDELSSLIRALGTIAAPAAQLTPFVLAHLSSRDLFVAGAAALLAAEAKLSEPELAELRRGAEEHCTIPRHPRAFDGSWDGCVLANDALEKLERIAKGEPVEPTKEL